MQFTLKTTPDSQTRASAIPVRRQLALLSVVAALCSSTPVVAQPNAGLTERWVQVEMTLFTYENANLDVEVWSPDKLTAGFPDRLVALQQVADVLQLDDWTVLTGVPVPGSPAILAVQPAPGPRPYAPGDSFALPDLARDAFQALPPSAHDFITTNRTLSQSPAHRIVYHNAWRQPLQRLNATPAVGLRGGREFGERSEVEGSVTVYAAATGDRLFLDTNLWLTQFQADTNSESAWALPVLPAALSTQWNADAIAPQTFDVTRIIQFNQSREMRVNQFHYLDHPALGMLVQVTPYERPAPPVLEIPVDPAATPASSQLPGL